MKRLVIGLILVTLLSVPMVAMALEQNIPVRAEIPGEFSCTVTDEFAQAAVWYPNWVLPPTTITTTKWGNIRGNSNYDWQVSADMGSVGWLVNTANPSIHLDNGLKIVMESWPESEVYIDGWSHKVAGLTEYTAFDNDYSFKQTVANEQPGTYSGTVTFTCVNMLSGTCGDGSCSGGETTTTCPEDCPATATCGNNVIEGTEACDDGNTVTGDGCSATCTIESGWICTPLGCEAASWCGDGYQDVVEECEPPTVGCSATCTWICDGDGTCDAGETTTSCPEDCPATATCGNNVIEGTEVCDDGNTATGDGCSATCTIESGYICTPLGCEPAYYCNDGYIDTVEQCQDGNSVTGDGCNMCAIETGYMCTFNNFEGQAGCSPLDYCHDGAGFHDPGEECDLDLDPVSVCSATCTRL